jgi:hypothetical protein
MGQISRLGKLKLASYVRLGNHPGFFVLFPMLGKDRGVAVARVLPPAMRSQHGSRRRTSAGSCFFFVINNRERVAGMHFCRSFAA